MITTDRRTYHLALSSTAGPAMVALSWSYPQDELLAVRRAQQAAAPVAAGLEVERLNFGYEISGDRPNWLGMDSLCCIDVIHASCWWQEASLDGANAFTGSSGQGCCSD